MGVLDLGDSYKQNLQWKYARGTMLLSNVKPKKRLLRKMMLREVKRMKWDYHPKGEGQKGASRSAAQRGGDRGLSTSKDLQVQCGWSKALWERGWLWLRREEGGCRNVQKLCVLR